MRLLRRPALAAPACAGPLAACDKHIAVLRSTPALFHPLHRRRSGKRVCAPLHAPAAWARAGRMPGAWASAGHVGTAAFLAAWAHARHCAPRHALAARRDSGATCVVGAG